VLFAAVLLLDTIVDFQPVHRNVAGRRDAQADLVSLHSEHGYLHIVPDDDRLTYAPGKNEHIWYLSLCAPVRELVPHMLVNSRLAHTTVPSRPYWSGQFFPHTYIVAVFVGKSGILRGLPRLLQAEGLVQAAHAEFQVLFFDQD